MAKAKQPMETTIAKTLNVFTELFPLQLTIPLTTKEWARLRAGETFTIHVVAER